MLVALGELLKDAERNRYAVGVRPAKGIVFHGWKSHSVRV